MIDIASAPKNIGHDRWVINMGGVHEVVDGYLYALKVRAQNLWLKRYWTDYVKAVAKNQSLSPYSLNFDNYELLPDVLYDFEEHFDMEDPDEENEIFSLNMGVDVLYPYDLSENNTESLSLFFFDQNPSWKLPRVRRSGNWFKAFIRKTLPFNSRSRYELFNLLGESQLISLFYRRTDEYVDKTGKKVSLFENSRSLKKVVSEIQPIFLTKEVFSISRMRGFTEDNYSCLNVAFNGVKSVKKKIDNPQGFFVVKQKRYRLKQFIPLRVEYRKTEVGNKLTDVRCSDAPYLKANSFIEHFTFKPTKAYRLLKKNRAQVELMSSQLSRRLLRTRKTLVLPAHVNLTLITNSYDVVHSWFLPSLGLKMDCIPGRSTHHSFYVDTTGFFYGQCAEICGRYHHHMPIRLCMLPYEHFFVWWQHFGLPKVLGTYNKARYEADYGVKKYVW